MAFSNGDFPGKTANQPRRWQVSFGKGFYSRPGKEDDPGTELPLGREFSWAGERWHLPALYLCGKGFVVDYCVEIPPERVKAFLDKWCPGGEEPRLSWELQNRMERENPLEVNFRSRFLLNGKPARQMGDSGLSYVPRGYLPEGTELPEKGAALVAHYRLDPEMAWSFHRQSFLWPQGTAEPVRSLTLTLERQPETVFGPRFRNPAEGEEIPFTHPVSGVRHRLTVKEYRQQQFSVPPEAARGQEVPTHYTAMVYTLDPALPPDTFTVRDCGENDPARPGLPREGAFGGAADIGIIGGADGPTAILLSEKPFPGERIGQPLRVAMSALHFAPGDDVQWRMEFRVRTVEDRTVTLI